MRDLAKEFRDAFPDPSIPSLPQLLATISGASSNHFYATVVKSNDRVPMFHDVVRWMLQRDLLVTLHLRVRIVVPAALKARARRRRDERRDRGWHTEEEDAFRSQSRRGRKVRADSGVSETDLELFDPSPAWYMRRSAGAVEPPILDEGMDLDEEIEKEEAEAEAEEADPEAEAASPGEDDEMEGEDDNNGTSILTDPGRATPLQRRWLQAMSEGKDELVARRFDQYVATLLAASY
jgi:nitrogen permease regulator 3-like protein